MPVLQQPKTKFPPMIWLQRLNPAEQVLHLENDEQELQEEAHEPPEFIVHTPFDRV